MENAIDDLSTALERALIDRILLQVNPETADALLESDAYTRLQVAIRESAGLCVAAQSWRDADGGRQVFVSG